MCNESFEADCWSDGIFQPTRTLHPEHMCTILMWLFAAAYYYSTVQQPHLQCLSSCSILKVQVSRKAAVHVSRLPGLTHSSNCFLSLLYTMRATFTGLWQTNEASPQLNQLSHCMQSQRDKPLSWTHFKSRWSDVSFVGLEKDSVQSVCGGWQPVNMDLSHLTKWSFVLLFQLINGCLLTQKE